jgi:hypothetical protein
MDFNFSSQMNENGNFSKSNFTELFEEPRNFDLQIIHTVKKKKNERETERERESLMH